MEFDQGPKKDRDFLPDVLTQPGKAGGPPVEHEALRDLAERDLARCKDAQPELKAKAPDIPRDEVDRLRKLKTEYQAWRVAYSEALVKIWKEHRDSGSGGG